MAENTVRIIIAADGSAAISGIKDVTGSLGDLEKGSAGIVGRMKSHWLGISAAVVSAYLTISKSFSFIEKSIELASAQEDAEQRLTTALGYRSQALIDQAQAMQQFTKYEDDAVIGAQALLAMFVKDEAQIKRATEATLDLAAAKGMDLEKAADLVSKTLGSSTNALSRYGIEVTGAVGSTERLESTVNNISRVFGGQAAAAAETYSGRVTQLKNAWGDMKEELGTAVTQNRFMIETTRILKGAIEDLTKWIRENKTVLIEMVRDAVLFAVEAFKLLIEILDKAAWGWRTAKAAGMGFAEAELAMQGDLSAAMQEGTKAVLEENRKKEESWKAFLDRVRKLADDIRAAETGIVAPSAPTGGGRVAPVSGMTDEEMKALEKRTKQILAQARAAEELEAREAKVAQARGLALIEEERATLAFMRKKLDLQKHLGNLTESQGIEEKYRLEEKEMLLKRSELLTKAATADEAELVTLSAEYGRIGAEIVRLEEYRTYELAARRLEIEREILDITREQKALLFESRMANVQEAFGAIGGSEIAANVGMLSALKEGQDPYQQDYDRWAKLQDQKIMRLQELGATEAELKDYYREYDLRMEETQQQQKIAMAANTFGMMANVANAFYAASGGKSKEAFALMKAMRIGETLMNTYSAAVGAYNALASIPIVGPALGAAAAAAAIAFGMAQVKSIAAMKPGGGGVSAAAPAGVGGGGSVPSLPSPRGAESPEPAKESIRPSQVINVHVYGNIVDHDQFARELAPALEKAWDDGV